MTPDAYVTTVLIPRQQAWIAEHSGHRFPPLLEWFIRDGDDALVETPAPAPKRERTPRRYRTAASLAAQRDRLQARRDRLGHAMSDDPAIARVGADLAVRNAARMDRELARATALDRRIAALDHRIGLAQHREADHTETEEISA